MARAASTDDPDAELLLRVGREGDEAALAALVARWQQPVVNFIFRMLPDAGEAEDLAQAVFVQLWRTAGRYQPQARFSTFLFTIARNLTLNEVRRRSRHPADSLEGAADPGDETPARQLADAGQLPAVVLLERAELAAKVDEALAALPEKQRVALALCRDTDLSYEDIAAVLGVTVPAVKSLLHRAREVLKARLKPYLRTGEWDPGRA